MVVTSIEMIPHSFVGVETFLIFPSFVSAHRDMSMPVWYVERSVLLGHGRLGDGQ